MSKQTAYTLFWVFVFVAAGITGNVLYTNHVDAKRAASDRAARAAEVRQAEASKVAVCALITANTAADVEQPPQTLAGKNKAAAWLVLKTQFGC